MSIHPHQALAAINHLEQACASAHIGYALYQHSGAERNVHNNHLDGNLLHHFRNAAAALGFDLVDREPLRKMPKDAFLDRLEKMIAENAEAASKCIPVAELMPYVAHPIHEQPGYRPLAISTDDRPADDWDTAKMGFR